MKITRKVRTILDNYSADSPGVKANLARILMQEAGGTGKIVICQSIRGSSMARHAALRSIPMPMTRITISNTIDAGLSAYAAPLA